MSLAKEIENNANITRYYTIGQLNTDIDALAWINEIRYKEDFSTNYLYFSDLDNRSDEGSANIQIDASADYSSMLEILNNRNVDIVLINCKYKGKPVVIGVDLRERMVYVTLRKRIPADFGEIEKELQLV